MPTYSCDTSGNGLFYWSANPGVPTYGGTQVTSHPDGRYEVNFDHGDGTDGSPAGSTQTYMAPDYVDPGCVSAGGGVYVPASVRLAPPLTLATGAQVTETLTPQVLVSAIGSGAAPHGYQLTDVERFSPQSVTVNWDGSGAAGSFQPCLAIYSKSGALLSRTFPQQNLSAGDTAEVTYAPF